MSVRVIASEHLIGANNDLRAQNERQRNQLASLNAAYGRIKSERDQLKADNSKLRELVRSFLYEHEDYIAEGNYFIGDLDLEHAMHHNQAYFRHEAKKLGIEVPE